MSLYVIDDHPMVRQMIGMLLRRLRPASKVVELEKYSELQAALIKNGEPELFVLDLLLPGVKGATAISDVKKMYPEIPLVVLSAMPSGEARDACLKLEKVVTDKLESAPSPWAVNWEGEGCALLRISTV